jgi:N-sulfoglucosamine sulfohydrolase
MEYLTTDPVFLFVGIIGKKHVGPESVLPFDFAERRKKIIRYSKNVTLIKELVKGFF